MMSSRSSEAHARSSSNWGWDMRGRESGTRRPRSSGFRAFDEAHELPEQVARVVRAGRRLRVVLHREHAGVGRGDALDGAVVEVDVRDLGLAAQRGLVGREAVVLRGQVDLLVDDIAHWMVAAAMSELELVRTAAERERENLGA